MEVILGFLLGIIAVCPAFCMVVKQRDQLDKEVLSLCKMLDEKENINDNK